MSTFYLDYENGSDSNDGSSWANAWKTITSGATAARVASGDVIRMAKSPDPVSLGVNGTWTNAGTTITLASAVTKTIDNCESTWTSGGTGVSIYREGTYRKQGTYSANLDLLAGTFTTGKIAYRNLGSTLNLSSYDTICFWIHIKNTNVSANALRLNLCSDTTGDTIVNSATIDFALYAATTNSINWYPVVVNTGGSLGSSIQSVSVTGLTTMPATDIYIDNIFAANDFTLNSLIGKNTTDDPWLTVNYIDELTVGIGQSYASSTTLKYIGTSETVTAYRRETIKTTLATAYTTAVQEVQDQGTTFSTDLTFSGGWNTANTTQDGLTIFDGRVGMGYGLYILDKDNVAFEKAGFNRYYNGVYIYSGANDCKLSNCLFSGNSNYGIYCRLGNDVTITNCWLYGNYYNVYLNMFSDITFDTCYLTGPASVGIANDHSAGVRLIDTQVRGAGYGYAMYGGWIEMDNCTLDNNTTGDIYLGYASKVELNYTTLGSTTEVACSTYTTEGSYIKSQNHDKNLGYNKTWYGYGNHTSNNFWLISYDSAFYHTATPSQRVTPNHATYKARSGYKKVAIPDGQTATIYAWVRKSAGIDGAEYNGNQPRLMVRANTEAGIAADTALDTMSETVGNWELLSGTTATVDNDAVVDIYVDCDGTAGWINVDDWDVA